MDFDGAEGELVVVRDLLHRIVDVSEGRVGESVGVANI